METKISTKNFNKDTYFYIEIDIGDSIGNTQYLYWIASAVDMTYKIGQTNDIKTRLQTYDQNRKNNTFYVVNIIKYKNCSKERVRLEETNLKNKLKFYISHGKEYYIQSVKTKEILENAFKSTNSVLKEVLNYNKYLEQSGSVHQDSFINAKLIIERLKTSDFLYVYKPTQSGKTSDLLATMILLDKKNKFNRHVIFSSLSDNKLRTQTRTRMVYRRLENGSAFPLAQVEHVLGLSKIETTVREICENLNKNATFYLFFDESHMALGYDQKIPTLVNQLSLKFPKVKFKYIFISATGFNCDALIEQGFDCSRLDLIPPKNYKGLDFYLKNQMVINNTEKITNKKEITNELFLKTYNKGTKSGYHLIRCDKKEQKLVEKYLENIGQVIKMDSENFLDLDVLNVNPDIPVFILIKYMLRAGITINKRHIQTVWDQSQSIANIVQGLAGRMTGCMDFYNNNLKIYTDKNSCEAYVDSILNMSELKNTHLKNASPGVTLNNKNSNQTKQQFVYTKQQLNLHKSVTKKELDLIIGKGQFIRRDVDKNAQNANRKRLQEFCEGKTPHFFGFNSKKSNVNKCVVVNFTSETTNPGVFLVTRVLKSEQFTTVFKDSKQTNGITQFKKAKDEKYSQSDVVK